MANWLERHRLDTQLAETLADSPVDPSHLDELAAVVSGDALHVVLRWIVAVCSTRKLASEIETASSRIHKLVAAIKGFSYMDQSAAPVSVDIGQGLSDTVTVLHGKARKKGIKLQLDVPSDLPRVQGFGGELNQVWANLIDNAIDAAPAAGHVKISASTGPDSVAISVVDDGAGVPSEIRNRIFDPFFTTKPMGQGTGLGLDIAQRIVRRHEGSIQLHSSPGSTEFQVTLPLRMQSR